MQRYIPLLFLLKHWQALSHASCYVSQANLQHKWPVDSCACQTDCDRLCESSCHQGVMQKACNDAVKTADLLLPSQGCLNCPCQAQQGHRQMLVLVVPSQMGQVITRLLCLIPAQPIICGHYKTPCHSNAWCVILLLSTQTVLRQ